MVIQEHYKATDHQSMCHIYDQHILKSLLALTAMQLVKPLDHSLVITWLQRSSDKLVNSDYKWPNERETDTSTNLAWLRELAYSLAKSLASSSRATTPLPLESAPNDNDYKWMHGNIHYHALYVTMPLQTICRFTFCYETRSTQRAETSAERQHNRILAWFLQCKLAMQLWSESTRYFFNNPVNPDFRHFGLLDPDSDPDRHQNLSPWSLGHALPSKKFCQNPFTTFSVIRCTDRQTNRPKWKHDLLLRRR